MAKQQATERQLQLLKKPIITEKTSQMAGNWVAFEVQPDAAKPEIRTAVETIYGVNVMKVNTLNQRGKVKLFRGFKGKQSNVKKAFVQLKDGQSIDMAASL